MIDQTLLVAALASGGVYFSLVAGAQLLRRAGGLRFRWTYHLFALAAGLLVGAWLLPAGGAVRAVALRHLTAAVVVLGALPLATALNRLFWIRHDKDGSRREAPRVLIDLTGVAVGAAAVLATLQFVYGLQVPGLLAGSGVVALVLGLGMQEQLKNMFAGIALHFEKPFQTGDWLLIDGVHAKVTEISWRSTRLLTTDEVQIEMDNSTLLHQKIYNFELPTPDHALRVTLGLHYDTPPARAMEVLRTATASVPGVVLERAPVVYLKDFADSAIVYEIKFWIRDHAQMSRVMSEVRAHCWYAVRRAGIEIPYPQAVVHHAPKADTGAATREQAAALLRAHKIFGCLGAEQTAAIVQASPVVRFVAHEHLVTQGAPGDSMFVLVKGEVDVRIAFEGGAKSVAKLGAGDCLGEMSLLTGDPRSATAVALGEVEAVEIGKAVFGAFVRAHPAVVEQLSDLLAQRQLANARHAADTVRKTPAEVREGLLRKLRSFFSLG